MKWVAAYLLVLGVSIGMSREFYVLHRNGSGLISYSYQMSIKGDTAYLDSRSIRGEHTCKMAVPNKNQRMNLVSFVTKEILNRNFSSADSSEDGIKVVHICEGVTEILIGSGDSTKDYSISCREYGIKENTILIDKLDTLEKMMSRIFLSAGDCKNGFYLEIIYHNGTDSKSPCASQNRLTNTSMELLSKDIIEKIKFGGKYPGFPSYLGNKNTDILPYYGLVMDFQGSCVETSIRKVKSGRYVRF